MKKIFLLLIFAVAGIGVGFAQNFQEVVYLKNGSVIRGVIIEQVPNQSVKIQTSDGNIFVYQISDVEKITKEQALVQPRQRYTNTYNSVQRTVRVPRETFFATPCYKGSIEWGFTCLEAFGTGVTTTHGAQINPYVYLGAGVGFFVDLDISEISVPIYADFKVNALKGRISPVFDFRLGYSAGSISGLYASTMAGCRFGLVNKLGLTLSLGWEGYGKYYSRYYYDHGLAFKLGFDF